MATLVAALAVAATACDEGNVDDRAGTPSSENSAPSPTTEPSPTGETSPTPSTTPQVDSRVVEFVSSTGERLVGRLFGPDRPRAIVLAHQIDDDQSDWFEFAQVLAARRFTVLTFNFEGYCGGGGCSRGNSPSEELWSDVAGAVAYVRDRGSDRVGLLGASMGGEASIAAAAHLGSKIAALATLSASMGLAEAGPGAARRDVRSIDVPKLFVAGRYDASAARAARAFDRSATEPKKLVILPFGEHGVDLLDFEPGERTRPLIVDFFERVLS